MLLLSLMLERREVVLSLHAAPTVPRSQTTPRIEMPRKGRGLENLVGLIEEALKGAEVAVRSPEHVKGRHSNETREIDVTLRGKVGSTDLLVIFECRERENPQGVDWIEQLATKKDDVGAHLAVAVSSSGFTRGAETLGAQKGILLRTLAEFDPGEVKEFFSVDDAAFVAPRAIIRRFHLLLPDGSQPTEQQKGQPKEGISRTTPIFGLGEAPPSISWQDVEIALATSLHPSEEIDDHLPDELPALGTDLKILQRNGKATFELKPGASAYLDAAFGRLPFKAIVAEYEFWVQVGRMRVEKWRSYNSGDEGLAYVASGELNFGSPQRADVVLKGGQSTDAMIRVHEDDTNE